jgi:hypothetical protein
MRAYSVMSPILAGGRGNGEMAYMIFLGLMIKHQRVQIKPVHVRATFCVRESFSAGR